MARKVPQTQTGNEGPGIKIPFSDFRRPFPVREMALAEVYRIRCVVGLVLLFTLTFFSSVPFFQSVHNIWPKVFFGHLVEFTFDRKCGALKKSTDLGIIKKTYIIKSTLK